MSHIANNYAAEAKGKFQLLNLVCKASKYGRWEFKIFEFEKKHGKG
jgi:hypothetical protein